MLVERGTGEGVTREAAAAAAGLAGGRGGATAAFAAGEGVLTASEVGAGVAFTRSVTARATAGVGRIPSETGSTPAARKPLATAASNDKHLHRNPNPTGR